MSLAAAQAIHDNRQPSEPRELGVVEDEQIKNTLEWAAIEDWVDEVDCGFMQMAGRKLSKASKESLAISINDLVAAALEVAFYE